MLTTVQLASNEAREASPARAASRVTQMLNLKDVMRHLPALKRLSLVRRAKCCASSVMFVAALLQRSRLTQPSQMLSDERLEAVERFVSEILNEDISLQKVRPL